MSLIVLLGAALIAVANARDNFPLLVPNGENVVHIEEDGTEIPWRGLGHFNSEGGGARNQFGIDFGTSGQSWLAICELDSDGDGLSNGFELGDETCTWTGPADNEQLRTTGLTHPGIATGAVTPKATTASEVKWHGALMCIAWLIFAPIGIISAAVYKVKSSSNQKVICLHWFKVHKLCLGTTVYLTLIAYAILVRFRGEFLTYNSHTKIGQAVVALALVQPVSGIYRVHFNKDGSKSFGRIVWEYLHQWLGRVLVILAFINIYLGFGLPAVAFSSGIEDGMKVIVILLLVVLGISSAAWGFLRKDHRKDPELPTKKDVSKTEEQRKVEAEQKKKEEAEKKKKEEAEKKKKEEAEKKKKEAEKKKEEGKMEEKKVEKQQETVQKS